MVNITILFAILQFLLIYSLSLSLSNYLILHASVGRSREWHWSDVSTNTRENEYSSVVFWVH